MKTCKLPLAEIVVADSRYRFFRKAAWDKTDPRQTLLVNSIKSSGMINPVIVHKTGEGAYHLVDGFSRALWAINQNETDIKALTYPEGEPVENIVLIALLEVGKSDLPFAKKALLVALAKSLGVKEDTLVTTILPALGFEPHNNVLKNIENAVTLPDEILEYCALKYFSMKQVNALSRRNESVLNSVFSWREKINLTARLFEAMTDQISDIVKARDINLDEFMEIAEIKATLNSNASSHERTERLKNAIEILVRPTLATVNAELKDVAGSATLSKGTAISWDRTLEKQEVNVIVTASSKDQFVTAVKALSSDKTVTAIEQIIDKL